MMTTNTEINQLIYFQAKEFHETLKFDVCIRTVICIQQVLVNMTTIVQM